MVYHMTKSLRDLKWGEYHKDISESVKEKIDLHARACRGDAEAVIQLTIEYGMATRSEFDEIKRLTDFYDPSLD